MIREAIKAQLRKRRLSVTAAAERLGIGRPALSHVINGNAELSVSLALKLERAFGMNARRLLNHQLAEQIRAAREAGE